MKKHYLYILTIFISLNSNAQIATDLNKIKDKFKSMKSYSINCHYRMVPDKSVVDAESQEYDSYYSSKEGLSYSKIEEQENWQTKKYNILIDHGSKMMIINKPDVSVRNYESMFYKYYQADTLLKQADRTETLTGKGTERGYRIHYKNKLYEYVEIYFDTDTYLIKALTVHYGGNVKGTVYISFSIKIDTEVKDQKIDISTFCYKDSKGRLIPTQKYSGYVIKDFIKVK